MKKSKKTKKVKYNNKKIETVRFDNEAPRVISRGKSKGKIRLDHTTTVREINPRPISAREAREISNLALHAKQPSFQFALAHLVSVKEHKQGTEVSIAFISNLQIAKDAPLLIKITIDKEGKVRALGWQNGY